MGAQRPFSLFFAAHPHTCALHDQPIWTTVILNARTSPVEKISKMALDGLLAFDELNLAFSDLFIGGKGDKPKGPKTGAKWTQSAGPGKSVEEMKKAYLFAFSAEEITSFKLDVSKENISLEKDAPMPWDLDYIAPLAKRMIVGFSHLGEACSHYHRHAVDFTVPLPSSFQDTAAKFEKRVQWCDADFENRKYTRGDAGDEFDYLPVMLGGPKYAAMTTEEWLKVDHQTLATDTRKDLHGIFEIIVWMISINAEVQDKGPTHSAEKVMRGRYISPLLQKLVPLSEGHAKNYLADFKTLVQICVVRLQYLSDLLLYLRPMPANLDTLVNLRSVILFRLEQLIPPNMRNLCVALNEKDVISVKDADVAMLSLLGVVLPPLPLPGCPRLTRGAEDSVCAVYSVFRAPELSSLHERGPTALHSRTQDSRKPDRFLTCGATYLDECCGCRGEGLAGEDFSVWRYLGGS